MLKVWETSHSVAKVLYIQNGRLPANHRQLLSAKSIYEKYHAQSSFVFQGQKKIYSGIVTKFSLEDFNRLVENSYFRTQDGALCEVRELEWEIDMNKATIVFEVREVYDRNLKEQFYEPG